MNSENFWKVLDHFMEHINSSKENPSLIIYDNHESHISVEITDKARDNGDTILTLPPHCSNKMHTLDVSVFGPFKSYYNTACDSWFHSCDSPTGQPIMIYNVVQCVGEVFLKAYTAFNIILGF